MNVECRLFCSLYTIYKMIFCKSVFFGSVWVKIIVLSTYANDSNVFGLMLNLLNRHN